MTTVLIDADIPVYRACWAVQKTHYTHKDTGEFFDGKMKAKKWWQEINDTKAIPDWEVEWDIVDEIEPWKNCKFLLNNYITEIKKNTGCDDSRLFLTPKTTFRHKLATIAEYKAGRPPSPHYKDQARQHYIDVHNAEIGNNIEADDMCGLNQTEDTVIASIDKDLYMIPGKHYDIVKKEHMDIDLLAADDWFFIQLIAGDKTDNVKGIPGMANIKAKQWLEFYEGDHKAMVYALYELYNDHYPDYGHEALYETAQLVWILRKGDKPGTEGWRSLLLLE